MEGSIRKTALTTEMAGGDGSVSSARTNAFACNRLASTKSPRDTSRSVNTRYSNKTTTSRAKSVSHKDRQSRSSQTNLAVRLHSANLGQCLRGGVQDRLKLSGSSKNVIESFPCLSAYSSRITKHTTDDAKSVGYFLSQLLVHLKAKQGL